ncbi:MAG: maleylpyruvate isomerase family mycothiol-dependent enzyme [Tessaracoccus sp.]|uniref:maleylpyruvate isomerase family mycothiol-dependent enzyme n=1 Tax=Tessaracoccus sp. TaxID=1971211 RepID=UPI001ECE3D25|nr:maleylpyruvate isomerase family mycothiol-dependent enzyme [Tessaracoccus sp.]MBK7821342.1 maleylpyruvate isomerase family mycothiol-dependent enzyme [Tessaracoccus sp.]
MDLDLIWARIDAGRVAFADLFESLSPEQLATPSLCRGWTVRDVGAHLAMSQARFREILVPLAASGFSFNKVVHRMAVESPLTQEQIAATVRSFVGSRRTVPFVTPTEPLIDILVHTQDAAIPLEIDVEMPLDAAVIAADRTLTLPAPLRFTRRYDHVAFEATDVDWRRGSSPDVVRGPISAILLTLTGRKIARSRLTGAVDLL